VSTVDIPGLGYSQVMGSCEHGNELSYYLCTSYRTFRDATWSTDTTCTFCHFYGILHTNTILPWGCIQYLPLKRWLPTYQTTRHH